jgi:hypothetical protein
MPRDANFPENPAAPNLPARHGVVGRIELIKSSFIDEINYSAATMSLDVVIGASTFTYHNIPYSRVLRFMQGRATCISNDPTRRRRWWRGKTPSIGAFYNQFIKLHGAVIRPTTTPRGGGGRTTLFQSPRRQQRAIQSLASSSQAEIDQLFNETKLRAGKSIKQQQMYNAQHKSAKHIKGARRKQAEMMRQKKKMKRVDFGDLGW